MGLHAHLGSNLPQRGSQPPSWELTAKLGHQACRWKLWAQEECMEWAVGSHSLGAGAEGHG